MQAAVFHSLRRLRFSSQCQVCSLVRYASLVKDSADTEILFLELRQVHLQSKVISSPYDLDHLEALMPVATIISGCDSVVLRLEPAATFIVFAARYPIQLFGKIT